MSNEIPKELIEQWRKETIGVCRNDTEMTKHIAQRAAEWALSQPVSMEQWRFAGAMPPEQEEVKKAAYQLAPWLSAALDDTNVCKEYKDAINAWFDAAMPAAPETVSMEPACEVSPYDVNTICWNAGHADAGCGSGLFTAAQLQAARQQGADEERKKHCACQWDADDNRTHTCVRHQGWLDVVEEWSGRAKDAENRIAELDAALKEWLDKTEWVQQGAAAKELGMHRADVLKQRIADLEKSNAVLLNILSFARSCIGHPDNIAMLDAAIAAAEVKP